MLTNKEIIRSKKLQHPILPNKEIGEVEKKLEVKFSKDFYELASACDYEYLLAAGYEFYNMSGDGPYTVIGETLKLRECCSLPTNYIVLAIQDDVTAVLLENISTEYPENRVIFCTLYDLQNIYKNKVMKEKPRIFPTFTDFFSYLLDEEEKKEHIALKKPLN